MSPRVKPRVPSRCNYSSSSQDGHAFASLDFSFSKTFEGETFGEAMTQVRTASLQLVSDLAADSQANLGGKQAASSAE